MTLDKKYQKTVQVKDRTFLICIYEIREKKHLFDFDWKTRIFHYWISDSNNRIEYAMATIEKSIKEEEEFENFQKELDNWADNVL